MMMKWWLIEFAYVVRVTTSAGQQLRASVGCSDRTNTSSGERTSTAWLVDGIEGHVHNTAWLVDGIEGHVHNTAWLVDGIEGHVHNTAWLINPLACFFVTKGYVYIVLDKNLGLGYDTYSCDWSQEFYIVYVPIDSSTHYPAFCTVRLHCQNS